MSLLRVAVTHGLRVTDTRGVVWRVDEIIEGRVARAYQIYPGHVQINLSPPGSSTACHFGIRLPEALARDWLRGATRCRVSSEKAGIGEYHDKGRPELCAQRGSEEAENAENDR